MPEPNVAPKGAHALNHIEAAQSTSPAQGSGLGALLNDPSNDSLFLGRVDDLYLAQQCAIVSLYGLQKCLPCVWLAPSANRWYGAKSINPMILGTEVLVYVPNDRKFGYILGPINAPADPGETRPSPQIVPEGVVNDSSPDAAQEANYWDAGDYVISAGAGTTVDEFPGDMGAITDFNLFVGVQRLNAVLRATELAKIEASVIDDLLKIVGWNLNEFTALGERRITADLAGVDLEENMASTQQEAMGSASKDGSTALGDKVSRPTGRWRIKRLLGYLGGMIREYVLRPTNKGDLDKPENNQDMGMYENSVDASGYNIMRSVAGIGMMKTRAIAVPKRRFQADDPGGDFKPVETLEKKPFKFQKSEFPQAIECQIRDSIAWHTNTYMHVRRSERAQDWHVPDENNCPAPEDSPPEFGLGGWTIDIPPEDFLMKGTAQIPDEIKTEGKKFRPGDSWCLMTEDGGFSMKTSCGCEISAHGGRLRLTAPKGVEIFSGASVEILGGDDVIVKAKKSIDLTATERQIHIKAEEDFLMTTVKGGMLFTTEERGHGFDKAKKGEQQGIPGIVFKTSGGFLVNTNHINLNVEDMINVLGIEPDKYPQIVTHTSSQFHWMDQSIAFKTGKKMTMIEGGNLFSEGRIQIEGSIDAKKHIWSGDSLAGSPVLGRTDWSQVPPLKEISDKIFDASLWATFQYPIILEDLPKIFFTYRSTEDYATTDGDWFGTHWQLQYKEHLENWEEKPLHGTYPWPGQKHYAGGNSLHYYSEVNVDETGRPRRREQQQQEGGKFTNVAFGNLKVHPSR